MVNDVLTGCICVVVYMKDVGRKVTAYVLDVLEIDDRRGSLFCSLWIYAKIRKIFNLFKMRGKPFWGPTREVKAQRLGGDILRCSRIRLFIPYEFSLKSSSVYAE